MHTQGLGWNTGRVLKIALLTLPLIVAAWFFGAVCRRMETGHLWLVFAMKDLLLLLRDLVLALAVVAATSGIVALLFRPLRIAMVVFVVSGLVVFLSWGVTAPHAVLALLFVLAALIHTVITQRDVSRRIRFSTGSLAASQFGFLVALVVVAAGALYIGADSYIQGQGLAVPERYSAEFAERLGSRVAAAFPSLIREQVHDGLRSYTEQFLSEELERLMKPVAPYVPTMAGLALLLPLLAVSYALSWVLLPVLWLVLALLRALGVTRITIESIEVKRLVLS